MRLIEREMERKESYMEGQESMFEQMSELVKSVTYARMAVLELERNIMLSNEELIFNDIKAVNASLDTLEELLHHER